MVRAGPLYPYLHTTQAPTRNSIAAELECSLFSELSLDSGLGASTAYMCVFTLYNILFPRSRNFNFLKILFSFELTTLVEKHVLF